MKNAKCRGRSARAERGPSPVLRHTLIAAVALLVTAVPHAFADDWPEFRGKGRLGVWTETGILEEFPEGGLTVRWRVPIRDGYAGPAVTDGRVFVIDARRVQTNDFIERVVCLDEATGDVLWTHEWEANYAGLQLMYAIGPRATPTVDEDRVYVQGAMGRLIALRVETGEVMWEKDYVRDYDAEVPTWGMPAAPLVDGDRLISLVGGDPDAKVVAFDKLTGEEIWRALSSDWEPGYNSPIIFEAGGRRQLIMWHPRAISSLDPETGGILWEEPFEVTMGMTVASPVRSGSYLLVSAFYNGSTMLRLATDRPAATLLWQSEGGNEIQTDKLHALTNTPIIQGDYVYGIDSYGQLRCLDARTGERIWESLAVTNEQARWATAFFVRNGDRYFINNDRGELIIGRFSPEGFHEISRTHLLEPTHPTPRRRELGAVLWSYPAYANKHIFMRNGKEIIRASLAEDGA